jgi:hypothetical protein
MTHIQRPASSLGIPVERDQANGIQYQQDMVSKILSIDSSHFTNTRSSITLNQITVYLPLEH